jgi:hypothetical protein
MPVRMDAQEGYRPLPPVVKARGHRPDAGRRARSLAADGVPGHKGRPRLSGVLRTIRSTACEPRPTTFLASGTRGHGADPGRAPCPVTGAPHAAVPRSRSLTAQPPIPIAPGHRGTGRAGPTLSPGRGRCAATRLHPDSRRPSTRQASLPPGTSLAQPPRGPARPATQRRSSQPTTRDRRPFLPVRLPVPPDRSPDGPGSSRVPVSAAGTLSHPGGPHQAAPACPGFTPGIPRVAPSLLTRCWPSVTRQPT